MVPRLHQTTSFQILPSSCFPQSPSLCDTDCCKGKYANALRELRHHLGAFAKLRKATISFVCVCVCVCLSVLMEQFGGHWTDLHEV